MVPSIVISAMYFSPYLYTPIKPVAALGFPRFFGVVEEEDEDEDDDEEGEDGEDEDEEDGGGCETIAGL
jgi:hypothetical protein